MLLIDFGEAIYRNGSDGLYDPKRDSKMELEKTLGKKRTLMTAAPEVLSGKTIQLQVRLLVCRGRSLLPALERVSMERQKQ